MKLLRHAALLGVLSTLFSCQGFCQSRLDSENRQTFSQAQRVLVLLHDIGQTGKDLKRRAEQAYASGNFDFVIAPTYDWKDRTIPEVAPRLFADLNRQFPNALFILDGMGKGGLVARWIAERTPQSNHRIERLVTEESPHLGVSQSLIQQSAAQKNLPSSARGIQELRASSATILAFQQPPVNDLRSVSAFFAHDYAHELLISHSSAYPIGDEPLPQWEQGYGSIVNIQVSTNSPALVDKGPYTPFPQVTLPKDDEQLRQIPEDGHKIITVRREKPDEVPPPPPDDLLVLSDQITEESATKPTSAGKKHAMSSEPKADEKQTVSSKPQSVKSGLKNNAQQALKLQKKIDESNKKLVEIGGEVLDGIKDLALKAAKKKTGENPEEIPTDDSDENHNTTGDLFKSGKEILNDLAKNGTKLYQSYKEYKEDPDDPEKRTALEDATIQLIKDASKLLGTLIVDATLGEAVKASIGVHEHLAKSITELNKGNYMGALEEFGKAGEEILLVLPATSSAYERAKTIVDIGKNAYAFGIELRDNLTDRRNFKTIKAQLERLIGIDKMNTSTLALPSLFFGGFDSTFDHLSEKFFSLFENDYATEPQINCPEISGEDGAIVRAIKMLICRLMRAFSMMNMNSNPALKHP